MGEKGLLISLLVTPLVGSFLSYFLSFKQPKLAGVIATLASALSFFCALSLFSQLDNRRLLVPLWDWFSFYGTTIRFELLFDHLSAVMCLVVTGVGSVIHLYSTSYMSGDPSEPRFFSYLNLFLFSMLILVLGSSLPVTFIGWEGVGLCSYLLIGFWFQNDEYAAAGQKAFVVNRIGDIGFLLAMVLLASHGLSLSYLELEKGTAGASVGLITVITLLLFLGASGKSAQIPLFTWLPDAMAGPTPVSALIHAATMVTAGVYLFARTHFLLDSAPLTCEFILSVGTMTAFVAATSAFAQRDIKKVLAYSTVSQLGFMFIAIGVRAYSVAIFHVVTHAFFKALLFLAAGSVIHGCHHEQRLEKFGGLWKKMPVTFLCYLMGTLAISGLPFFSGAVSKDLILENLFGSNLQRTFIPYTDIGLVELCWAIAVVTAGMTAFYMFRSLILTFFGSYRGEGHPHESPILMLAPLVILAIPSVCFGVMYGESLLEYLSTWRGAHVELSVKAKHLSETSVLISAATGAIASMIIFLFLPAVAKRLGTELVRLRPFLESAWRFDEFYRRVILIPLNMFSRLCSRTLDRGVIDGTVNGTALIIESTGEIVRRFHSGKISHFISLMFFSFVFLVTFLFLIR